MKQYRRRKFKRGVPKSARPLYDQIVALTKRISNHAVILENPNRFKDGALKRAMKRCLEKRASALLKLSKNNHDLHKQVLKHIKGGTDENR